MIRLWEVLVMFGALATIAAAAEIISRGLM